jgi:hypothetical protein
VDIVITNKWKPAFAMEDFKLNGEPQDPVLQAFEDAANLPGREPRE